MCSFFYPFCVEKDRYDVTFKYFNLFFVIDDHTENPDGDVAKDHKKCMKVWGQYNEALDKIEGATNVRIHHWKPYIFAWYAALERVYVTYNAEQKRRFLKLWRAYCQGNLEETAFLASKPGFQTLDDIINVMLFLNNQHFICPS